MIGLTTTAFPGAAALDTGALDTGALDTGALDTAAAGRLTTALTDA